MKANLSIFLLASLFLGFAEVGFSDEPALTNLEVQFLGRKFEAEPSTVRMNRLEAVLAETLPLRLKENSIRFRLAELYAMQQAGPASGNSRAALQAYNLAIDEAQRKHVDKAVELYRRAIALDNKLVPAYNNLAALLDSQRNYPEAIKAYQQALSLKPADPYLHRNLGVVYEKTGQVEQALAHYKAYLAVADKPDPPIQSILETYERSRKLGGQATDYVALTDQVTGGERLLWPEKMSPLNVYIDIKSPSDTLFMKEAQKALDIWSKALKGRLHFTQASSPEAADISIGFKKGPLSHPFLDVGHANFSMADRRSKEGMKISITVNTGEEEDRLPSEYRSQQVGRLILHELGHAIGIWGHSPDPGDIMFTHPIAQTLSRRDINTIQKLYGIQSN